MARPTIKGKRCSAGLCKKVESHEGGNAVYTSCTPKCRLWRMKERRTHMFGREKFSFATNANAEEFSPSKQMKTFSIPPLTALGLQCGELWQEVER